MKLLFPKAGAKLYDVFHSTKFFIYVSQHKLIILDFLCNLQIKIYFYPAIRIIVKIPILIQNNIFTHELCINLKSINDNL